MDSPDHLPRERPVLRSLPATVLAALLIAHCSFVGDDHAALLAQELERRHSGQVESVVYEPANFLDPPLFLVRLRQGITHKEAVDLVCRSVVPTIEASAGRIGAREVSIEAWVGEQPIATHCWR